MNDIDDCIKLPPEVDVFLTKLSAILRESPERQIHVCQEGCHCRQAYRKALAENLEGGGA